MKKVLNVIYIFLCVILAATTTVFCFLYKKADENYKFYYGYCEEYHNAINSINSLTSQLSVAEQELAELKKQPVDLNTVKDFGTFKSVETLREEIKRNPYQSGIVKVTVTGFAYRDGKLYIGDYKENSLGITSLDKSNCIYTECNTDKSNRALTGDKIRVTGILKINTVHFTAQSPLTSGFNTDKYDRWKADNDEQKLTGNTAQGFYIYNAKYEILK